MQAEIALIERSANDYAHDSVGEPCSQLADIVEGRGSPGSNHRQPRGPGDFRHPERVDSRLRAVASNIRHNSRRDPCLPETFRRLNNRQRSCLDPPFYRETAVANVERTEY